MTDSTVQAVDVLGVNKMENKQQFLAPNQSFFSSVMELIGKQAIETQLKNTVLKQFTITIYGDGTVKMQEDCNTSIIDERKVQSFRQPESNQVLPETQDKTDLFNSKQTEKSFIQSERMRDLLENLVGNGITNKSLRDALGISSGLYLFIRYKNKPIEQELCRKIKSLNLYDLFLTQLGDTIYLDSQVGKNTQINYINHLKYIITKIDGMSLREKIKYIVSKQNTSQEQAIKFIANEIGRSKGYVHCYFYEYRKKPIRNDAIIKLNNLVIEYLIKEQKLAQQKSSFDRWAKKKQPENIDKQG